MVYDLIAVKAKFRGINRDNKTPGDNLLVGGLGDVVQAIKAGLMEIADVFVVNKADVPEAKRVVKSLEMLRSLEGARPDGWVPPVVETIATTGTGVAELAGALSARGSVP